MHFTTHFLNEIKEIIDALDVHAIEQVVDLLVAVRNQQGRLFILGVGGSAANASHAVNDFRKITHIEAYAPTDNVAELTARTNDEGWESIFSEWLKISRLNSKDLLLIFSVGGGDVEKNISPNLIAAIDHAKKVGAKIAGCVGRANGYTAQTADACVIIPTINASLITPHAEAFQAILWHLFVSHPKLKVAETKWESVNIDNPIPVKI